MCTAALGRRAGYTYATLHTVPREQWQGLGVRPGAIEQLEVKLRDLRHDDMCTIVDATGQVTQVAFGNATTPYVFVESTLTPPPPNPHRFWFFFFLSVFLSLSSSSSFFSRPSTCRPCDW